MTGLVGYLLLFKTAEHLSKGTKTILDDLLVKHCRGPARLIIPLLVIHFFLPFTRVSEGTLVFLTQVLSSLLIISVAWLVIKLTSVLEDFVLNQYRIDVKDNLRARRIHTQIQVLRKVVIVVVGVLALATILMTFSKVRQLGISILASAGIIGIIVGIAAQRSIATLLAGVQIAITQPIRIDDVVIVENEWGRVEEITLTYVVVRIWDLRRLILPITYFLEKPFQNWTRVSAEILGTVFLYVDYTVPVQMVREELQRILQNSKLWDGRVCVLQVTNATERTVELRALMSAPDSSSAWGLRCEVREKLIEFVKNDYPDGLPKLRAEVQEPSKKEILS
ncbi:MAG: mechanosensitive ion channel [Desulfobacterales bacterium]|nr:mechanosensitive ion channel [Desulfobacterales bacterium]